MVTMQFEIGENRTRGFGCVVSFYFLSGRGQLGFCYEGSEWEWSGKEPLPKYLQTFPQR